MLSGDNSSKNSKISGMKLNLLIALFTFLVFGLSTFLVEKIPINRGFGWDGLIYGNVVAYINADMDSPYQLTNLSSYSFQRIAPSIMVHYGLLLFSDDPTQWSPKTIVRGFEILNLFILVGSAFVWGLIADNLKLTPRWKIMGFFALFVNYANLKFNIWNPVLTDVTCFGLTVILVYFYLKGYDWGMLFTLFIGAFTWPSFFLCGMFLFIFPNQKSEPRLSLDQNIKKPTLKIIGEILSITLGLLTFMAIIYFTRFAKFNLTVGRPLVQEVLLLSALFSAIFITLGVRYLLIYNILSGALRIDWRSTLIRVLLITVIFTIIKGVVYNFSNPDAYTLTAISSPLFYLREILVLSALQPLVFGIGHIVYYGPILIFTFLLWPQIVCQNKQFGLGLSLVMSSALLFALNPNGRNIINLAPIIIIFTVKCLDKMEWKKSHYLIFIIATFIFSKVWLQFNINAPLEFPPLSFPWQTVFGNMGHMMSAEMYIAQGAIIVLLGIIFQVRFLQRKT